MKRKRIEVNDRMHQGYVKVLTAPEGRDSHA